MKSPVQLFVQFPDGNEYAVEEITFAQTDSGPRVVRIETDPASGKPPGAWHILFGDELAQCRLIVRAPGIEYWSERTD